MLRARVMKIGPVLPIFLLAHFSHHVATGGLIPMLPWLRDYFQLDYFRAGLMLSAFSLTMGFVQVPMGGLADRWSKTTMVGIGLIGVAIGSVAVGLSPTYYVLLGVLVLIGFFGSTYHAPASSFLSQFFSQAERGRVLGTHMIAGTGSLFVTPLVAVGIVTLTGDWRYSFIALAFPALLAGFFLLTVGRRHERANLAAAAARPREKVDFKEIIRLIGLVLGLAMTFQLITSSINSYLPLFLVDGRGVSKEVAGIIASLVPAAGVIGAPIGGILSDRIGRRPIIVLSIVLTGPAIYLVTVFSYGPLLVAAILLYGFVMSFRFPSIESLIADTVPWHRRATVLGIYSFFAQEAASVLNPIIGSLIDSYGLSTVFGGIAIFSMAFSGSVVFLRKRL